MQQVPEFNAVVTYGKPFAKGVKSHRISIDLANFSPQERYRLSRMVARSLETKFNAISSVVQEDSKMIIYLVSEKKPEMEEVEVKSKGITYKIPIKYEGEVLVTLDKLKVLNELLRGCIKKRIKEKGFRKSFTPRKYYGGTPKFFIVGEFQEPVYVYDGFEIESHVFPDGSAIVFLEPKSTWRINLLEYTKILLARGVPLEEIKEFVIKGRPKRKVKTAPYGSSGLIIDLLPEKSVDEEVVNGESLRAYWLKTHKIKLPDDDFVVYVDMDKAPLPYPASQVFLSTKEMPFSYRQRRIFILPPKRKKEKTMKLLKLLLEQPLNLGDTKIVFKVDKLVSLDTLKREGKIKEYGVFDLPILRFFNDGIGRNPYDISIHGPYSGPANVNVLYVAPASISHIIDPLHDVLDEAYKDLKLGFLTKKATIKIEGKPTKIAYRRTAGKIAKELGKIPDPKIAIVLLPSKGEQKFEFIKGVSERTSRDKVKSYQFLLVETARKIIGGKKSIAYNLASQIYFKASPGEKRTLWILLNPAGEVGNTVYAAYDVSREITREYDEETRRVIREKKEAAARAAICDCFGFTIKMKSKISPTGEILTSETIKDLILGLEEDARKALKQFGHELKRFVLFKDGEVHLNERVIVRRTVSEIREATPDVDLELYSVIKRSIKRIYIGEKNPPPGFYVIFADDKSGLIVSSDLSYQRDKTSGEERLSASTLLIKKEVVIPQNKFVPIKQILQEFFDLTRLHWQSLKFKMKTCLPLKLVQEIGQYSRREIIIPEDISYIPL